MSHFWQQPQPVQHSLLSPGLTRPQGDALAGMQAATCKGMAHWAGSGPTDETCRTCAHWGGDRKRVRRFESGELRPARCAMFTRLSQGSLGDGVEHDRAACRHWLKREKPPVAVRERKPAAPEDAGE